MIGALVIAMVQAAVGDPQVAIAQPTPSVQPAAAQPATGPATAGTKVYGDPNEVHCHTQRVTGSRLASRKVCRTRAEEDDLAEQERRIIDRIQGSHAPDTH